MSATTYSPSMAGTRAIIARYGEVGEIVGPALDPARCTFRPDGPAGVVESITPRVADLRPLSTPSVISRDPLACRVRWHDVGCVVEGLSDGTYRHTGAAR